MILPFTCEEITVLLRLERAVTREALKLGFDGDPLADPMPQPKDEYDLNSAYRLFYCIPTTLRNQDRELALRMCRCAVWDRTRGDDRPPMSDVPWPASPSLSVDAKLARERRRVSA